MREKTRPRARRTVAHGRRAAENFMDDTSVSVRQHPISAIVCARSRRARGRARRAAPLRSAVWAYRRRPAPPASLGW